MLLSKTILGTFEIALLHIQFSKNESKSEILISIILFHLLTSLSRRQMKKNYLVEVNGIEPMTSCVQSRCSPN